MLAPPSDAGSAFWSTRRTGATPGRRRARPTRIGRARGGTHAVADNRLIAAPRGRLPLSPAPAPRRFAQAVNAAFNLGSGATLLAGWSVASWVLQAMLVAAFSLLLFAKFCLGAYVFHLLRGEAAFANRTLPWARD